MLLKIYLALTIELCVLILPLTRFLMCSWYCSKPELLKGVYEMGFNAPSKIQETALPALLADPLVFSFCIPAVIITLFNFCFFFMHTLLLAYVQSLTSDWQTK